MICVLDWTENIVRKGENAAYEMIQDGGKKNRISV